jgi:tRNA threonylcarbamoyladenosine biosynthesis protein TsaE
MSQLPERVTREFHLPAPKDTDELGAKLATVLRSPFTVHLRGALGAGKSALVRSILRAKGVVGPIPSPTYTLIEEYAASGSTLQHLDLYRLADAEELEFIGTRDLFLSPAVRFIEWPERGGGFLPVPDLVVTLTIVGTGRQAHLEAGTDRGGALLRCLTPWQPVGLGPPSTAGTG